MGSARRDFVESGLLHLRCEQWIWSLGEPRASAGCHPWLICNRLFRASADLRSTG
jgi:hypothetical protein